MNVASLELCKELYELSGWHPVDIGQLYYTPRIGSDKKPQPQLGAGSKSTPAYDLGYLMRKLPRTIPFSASEISLRLEIQRSGGWLAHYGIYDWKAAIASTPADATAKLAIALFEAGVLTKGDA